MILEGGRTVWKVVEQFDGFPEKYVTFPSDRTY